MGNKLYKYELHCHTGCVSRCGRVEPEEIVKLYIEKNNLDLRIEVETRNIDNVKEAVACDGIHRIMLDNFTPEKVKEAVDLINGKYETEASGGITLETIRPYAEAGVDFISVGAITHSVRSLDLSLKAEIG